LAYIKLILANNTILNYETGYSTPTFDTIVKFLDICDFEMQFIDKNITWKIHYKKIIYASYSLDMSTIEYHIQQ